MNPALLKFIHANREQDIGEHLETLYGFAFIAPGNVLELGVRHGLSTAVIGVACHDSGKRLISVDCEPCAGAKDIMRKFGLESEWTFIQSDDRVVNLPEKEYGFIFVDTSHEREHTRQEIALFAPMVKPGGYMGFHDTYLNGEYWPGVADPVYEFLDQSEDWKVAHNASNNNGLMILQKEKE